MKLANYISSITSAITLIMMIFIFQYIGSDTSTPNTYDNSHKVLLIDRNFDDQEAEFITSAALDWNHQTNHAITIDVVYLPNKYEKPNKNSILVIKVSPDYPDIIMLDMFSSNITLGYYEEQGPIKLIEIVYSRIDLEQYKAVALHEIGHALGLKHNIGVDGIGTLMFPNIDYGSNKITDKDLKKFCRLYKC